MGTFSGSFAWPYLFPFPQRPPGLIDAAFDELARRWRPILDACEDNGVNLCYEIHPSEDLHDGTSFERFLNASASSAAASCSIPATSCCSSWTTWTTSTSTTRTSACSM
jgi:hypothetical protein